MRSGSWPPGDYKMTVQTETLLLKKGDTPGDDIARLRAARLVSAVESKGGKRLNEALAKQLTGGDPIAVRFLYKEFFEYTPTFKVLLAVNHLPIIGDTGYAMWERVKLVPFKVVIPKVEQDKALKDKLRAELPGILRWAVQGCMAWQEHGLGEPAAVVAATAAYRSDMDTVAQFLKECCIRDPKAVVSFADVYDAYTKWEEGYPLGPKAFNTRLRRLGIKEGARLNAARRWIGLRVTEVTDVTQNPGSSTVPAIGENPENLVTTVTIDTAPPMSSVSPDDSAEPDWNTEEAP